MTAEHTISRAKHPTSHTHQAGRSLTWSQNVTRLCIPRLTSSAVETTARPRHCRPRAGRPAATESSSALSTEFDELTSTVQRHVAHRQNRLTAYGRVSPELLATSTGAVRRGVSYPDFNIHPCSDFPSAILTARISSDIMEPRDETGCPWIAYKTKRRARRAIHEGVVRARPVREIFFATTRAIRLSSRI